MNRHNLRGLYAITPDDFMLPRLIALVKAALDGGVRLVQYRNKSVSADLRRVQAGALLSVCRVAGAKLIVNDDISLAVAINADGAHLGRDDFSCGSLLAAREALGPDRVLGVSCYNDMACAEAAVVAQADYLAVGSMFASTTKPQAVRASLDLVRAVRQRFDVPVCAIGGISLTNAPTVIDAGADMLAVISSLFDVMDIAEEARRFQSLFPPLTQTTS
ncbi:MAG: thiamine phosphate synthase [Rhodocyclaceae bacterium]|jgi:thiamine-phosphate pyrophosphorylase|nr:thiamine phosphate synthase [Rhodocyclaceae bacterium]